MALGKVAEYKIRNVIETITDEQSRKRALKEHEAFQEALSQQDREKQERSFANLAKTLSAVLGKEIDIAPMIKSSLADAMDDLADTIKTSISESVAAGIKTGFGSIDKVDVGDLKKKLERLNTQKSELKAKKEEIAKSIHGIKTDVEKTKKRDGFSFDDEYAKKVSVEEVTEVRERFTDAAYELESAIDEYKNGEMSYKEYVKIVVKAQKALQDVQAMSAAIESVPHRLELSQERKEYDKIIYGNVDKKDKGLNDYIAAQQKNIQKGKRPDAGETELIQEYIDKVTHESTMVGNAWDEVSESVGKSIEKLSLVEKKLQSIDAEIVDVTSKVQSANTDNDALGIDVRKGKEELGKAQKRMTDARIKKLTETLSGSMPHEGFGTLKENYETSVDSGKNWEVQYQWLVKFVNKYREYQSAGKMQDQLAEHSEFFKSLEMQYDSAKASLEDLLNIATGNANLQDLFPAERHEDGGNMANAGEPSQDDLTLAQQIREEKELAAKAAREEQETLLKNKEILETILKISKELGGFYNSSTGEFSEIEIGDDHSTRSTLEAWKRMSSEYDTRVHKHNFNIAAPSFSTDENDFKTWINGFDYIKKQMIVAKKEILSFDFSSLDVTDLKKIADEYAKAAKEIDDEFEIYISNEMVGEMFGSLDNMDEQMQARLRQALESIMKGYEGVMTSYQLPDIPQQTESQTSVGTSATSLKNRFNADADRKVEEEAKARADERRNELAQQLELYDDDENTYSLEESELQKEALRDILNALKQEGLLTDELQAKYDAINSKIDERVNLLKSVYQAYDSLEKAENIDYNPDDINEVQQALDKRKEIISAIPQNVLDNEDDIVAGVEEIEQGNIELEKRIDLLKQVKQGLIDIDDVDDIISETGDLDSKLERLGSIAEQWGSNIKDGDEDDAEKELEAFEETYDRIILKLAKGRKIEILPNAKGLRALYKYYDGIDSSAYGETEIEDIIFERVKKEADAHRDVADAIRDETAAQGALNDEKQEGASGTGSGDASKAELESARAEAESLRQRAEAAEREKAQAAEDNAGLRSALIDAEQEKTRLQQGFDAEKATLNETIASQDNFIETLKQERHQAESEMNSAYATAYEERARADKLQEQLDAISANVPAGGHEGKGGVSINKEELSDVLKNIVYKVQIETDRAGSDDEGPWAREETLSTAIKSVLDGILANTAKNEPLQDKAPKSITVNLSTVEGKLGDILAVVKNINTDGKSSGAGSKPEDNQQQEPKQEDKESEKKTKKFKELIALTKEYNKVSTKAAKASDGELKTFYTQEANNLLEERQKILDGILKTTKLTASQQAELDALESDRLKKLTEVDAGQADKDFKNQVRDAQKESIFKRAQSSIKSADGTVFDTISNLDFDQFSGDFKTLFAEYQHDLEAFKKAYNTIKEEVAQTGIVTDEQRAELLMQSRLVDEHTQKIRGLVTEYDKLSGDNVQYIGQNLLGDASTYKTQEEYLSAYRLQLEAAVREKEKGKATITGFDAATKTLNYTIQTGKNEFTQYSASVRGADDALVSVQGATKKAESVFEKLKRKTKEVATYFTSSLSIYAFVNQIKQGIQYVKEIDSALTELKKVTDETDASYERFLQHASSTGARIGSTISEFTQATAEFARLGYNIDLASQMAEAALVYTNVGDGLENVTAASESIISAMKGFGMEASETMAIVDRFNEVGNRFAITSVGIGDALQRSASALYSAGNTIDESIGLITAANSVVQDPTTVGTALKTLSLRVRGAKVELEEAGEDIDGMANSTSELQEKLLALTGGQVDIMLDQNTFKNTTQILREMADVWDQMSDVNQAAALELLGGKRQANVLSAIISDFETVEDVIKTSMDSSGSAIKENEKYLNSIQGKMDQFTNAVQAMWSKFIDSDVVKKLVDIGTHLVRIVEKLGLIPTILIAIGATKGFNHIFDTIKNSGVTIQSVVSYLNSFTVGFKANAAAQTAANAATMASTAANKLFRTSLVESLATQYLEKQATEALMLAKYNLKLAEMGLMNGVATTADVQAAQAAVEAASIPVDISKIGTTELMGLAFKQLAASIWGATKAIVAFLFTNPVGWIILAIGAIAGGIAVFNHFHKTTEELREELSELQSELSDVQQELEGVNNELETTQSRMAELLAMESLSFTEKEELENLKKQNDELQRELDLLELKEKQKAKETADKFVETMESDVNDHDEYYGDGSKVTFWSKIGYANYEYNPAYSPEYISESERINREIEQYKQLQQELVDVEQKIINADGEDTKEGKKLSKEKAHIEKSIGEIEEYINGKTSQWAEDSAGLDYGINEETDAWLDYIKNVEDKWAITSGGKNAQTNAITRIFNKEEFEEASNQIDALAEKLERDPGNKGIENEIRRIIETTPELKENLEEAGVSADAAFDYFTMSSSGTIDDKIEELSSASQKFVSLLNGGLFKVDGIDTGLAGLFDEEGKIIQTKLSEIFVGTDEKTRQEITSVLEGAYDSIKDGLDSGEIESLTSKLGFKFSRQIMEIQKAALSTETIKLFPWLDDEISGIIDKFDELVNAVGSVVDSMETLDQARAEETYSGSVSLETLSKLMESTENYADIIEVDETGAIKLASNAQEILIQQKLDAIKKNAEVALSDAELALQEAIHAEQTYTQTGPAQDFLRGMTMEVGGAIAFVTSLWNDLVNGNFDGAWERAKSAKASSLENSKSEYAAKAEEASVAVKDAEKRLANAEKMNKIAQGLTPDNVTERYSSDEASGGTDDADDARKKIAEEGWEAIVNEYENKLALITNERDLVQAEIDRIEAQGGKASKELYNDLIRSQLEERRLLVQKKKELEAYLEQYGDSIDPDTWTEYNNEINETAVAITECTTNVYDFAQSLKEIDMHYFNQALDDISRLGEEIEWIMSLFEDEEMSDEAGNWTEAGIAKINLLRDQMTTYAAQAEMWQNRLNELGSMTKGKNGLYAFDEETKNSIAADFKSMLDAGNIDKEDYFYYMKQLNEAFKNGGFSEELWTEWNNEAEDGLRDAISSQQDARDEMLDMYDAYLDKIEEGIEKEIDAYNDLIDAKKEELQAERDLYDFRNKIKDQTKDVAALERRIAALSGSTSAADVAERRKLEAELAEKKEAINDTYYDHAQNSRSSALDDEAEAFEKAKKKYVETMRETANDTEWVINEMLKNGIFNADVANEFLQRIQDTYNVPLSEELTIPWNAAAETARGLKESVGVPVDETVTMISDSIVNQLGTDDADNPWNQAISMADKYADFLTTNEFALDSADLDTFEGQIGKIVSGWEDVKNAADKAYAAQDRTYEVGGTEQDNGGDKKDVGNKDVGNRGNNHPCDMSTGAIRNLQNVLNTVYNAKVDADGSYGPKTKAAVKSVQNKHGIYASGLYDVQTRNAMLDYIKNKWQSKNGSSSMIGQAIQQMVKSLPMSYYAKGTLGTTKDGLAITDESWIGEEITLAAGKNGQLQYLKKGSSVLPADISANLVEWGKLNPNMLNVGTGTNLNMISNAISKPEFNITFDSLIRAENITEETLPAVKKLVTQELNRFTRELNYALKGKGAR